MAFYVEVMCSEQKDGSVKPMDEYALIHRCWSHRGDNPQGADIRSAVAEARRQGWTVRGRYACCPGCVPDTPDGAARSPPAPGEGR